ncbi:MAG: hypothetical protein WCH61_05660, partial [bacterium]
MPSSTHPPDALAARCHLAGASVIRHALCGCRRPLQGNHPRLGQQWRPAAAAKGGSQHRLRVFSLLSLMVLCLWGVAGAAPVTVTLLVTTDLHGA